MAAGAKKLENSAATLKMRGDKSPAARVAKTRTGARENVCVGYSRARERVRQMQSCNALYFIYKISK